MSELPFRLERAIVIRARRDIVFRYFTDSARWAKWWGAGSTIEPRAGGRVYIRHPGGVETVGEVVEIAAPERIAFTYGFATGRPIPIGGSRVTIRLTAEGETTRLDLSHEFAEAVPRDEHVQGWRFQLSLFSNVIADEVHADAAKVVDAWFQAWSIADEPARREAFRRVAVDGVEFRDRFSALSGMDDLVAHAGASQRFMPGLRLERRGAVRHCQGMVLADWTAVDQAGQQKMSGTNVFQLAPDTRIEAATGFAGVTD